MAPVQLNDLEPSSSSVFHRIDTGSAPPVTAKVRRLPDHKLKAVKSEFSDLLQAGIIKPSSSPWCSPIHVVPKRELSSWRPCGDFRALNAITKPDKYPLPLLSSLSASLSGASVFSKLDLRRAYHLIRIHPNDVEKTAVISPLGLFHYRSMPFGYVTLPVLSNVLWTTFLKIFQASSVI